MIDQDPHPGLFRGDVLQVAQIVDRLGDHQTQITGSKGLGDEIKRSLLHGFDGMIERGIAGDDNRHRIRVQAFELREHLHARQAGHHQIEQHDVKMFPGDQR